MWGVIFLAILVIGISFMFYIEIKSQDKNHLPSTSVSETQQASAGFRLPDCSGNDCATAAQYHKTGVSVYYGQIKITLADTESFTIFPLGVIRGKYFQKYAFDNTYVYYEGEVVKEANPKTFKPAEWQYDSQNPGLYGVDDKHAYYKTNIVKDADPKTFKVIWNVGAPGDALVEDYASDKLHVYLNGKVIDNADPKTFHDFPEQG